MDNQRQLTGSNLKINILQMIATKSNTHKKWFTVTEIVDYLFAKYPVDGDGKRNKYNLSQSVRRYLKIMTDKEYRLQVQKVLDNQKVNLINVYKLKADARQANDRVQHSEPNTDAKATHTKDDSHIQAENKKSSFFQRKRAETEQSQ